MPSVKIKKLRKYDDRGLDDWLFAAQRLVYTAFLACFLVVTSMIFLFPTAGQLNAATLIFLSVFVRLYSASTVNGGEEQHSTEMYLLTYLMMVESLVLSFLNTNYNLTYVLAMLSNLILMFNGMLFLVAAKEKDHLQKRLQRKAEREEEEIEIHDGERGMDWREVFNKFGEAVKRNEYYDLAAISLMIALDMFGFNIVWFYVFAYNEFSLDAEKEAAGEHLDKGKKGWWRTRFVTRVLYYVSSFTFITLCLVFNGVNGNNEATTPNIANWIFLSLLFIVTTLKNGFSIWKTTKEGRWFAFYTKHDNGSHKVGKPHSKGSENSGEGYPSPWKENEKSAHP